MSRVPRDRLAMPHRMEPDGFAKLYYAKGDGNMHAAGGLVTTATDLARWLRANSQNELLGRLEFSVVDGKLEARMGRLWSAVEVYDNRKNVLRVELRGGGDVVPFVFGEEDDRASALRYLGQEFRRVSS